MSGSSIFSNDFNWETVIQSTKEQRALKKAKELEILREQGKIIEDSIKKALEVGCICYEFSVERTFTHEMINLLIDELSNRFPGRVHFYDEIFRKYILVEKDFSVKLGCYLFKVDFLE